MPFRHFKQPCRAIVLLLFVLLSACNIPKSQAAPATQTAMSARETLYADIFSELPTLAVPTQEITGTPYSTSVSLNPITQPSSAPIPAGMLQYISQSGDTLAFTAAHFAVTVDEIQANSYFENHQLLPPGTELIIPDKLSENAIYDKPALPDSEVVYGPDASSFDLLQFAQSAGGYLTRYSELIDGVTYSGPEIVQMIALETSTNPRLLLAFLEFRSNWVLGNPPDAEKDRYPIGFDAPEDYGLYKELMITARVLAEGYYGWRYGTLHNLRFNNGVEVPINPKLNAGTVALQRLFTSIYYQQYWEAELYGEKGFLNFFLSTFGDPWLRSEQVSPLLDHDTSQPELALPFLPGLRWAFTAGPHAAWQTGTPRGALDFAPVTGEAPCAISVEWVTASAPGIVARSMRGTLALDLDGDEDEGTGWVLVYMHVAEKDRAQKGTSLPLDGLIGHPSCERGNATGTHVHLARKYNGEWIATDGPLPLVLSGWQAFAGEGPYEGTLVRGYQTVISSSSGKQGSSIYRDDF